METEGKHRAVRPEREEVPSTTGAVRMYVNPYAVCTGSDNGRHHVAPCPMHHPSCYAKMAPRRWKHRQAVAS